MNEPILAVGKEDAEFMERKARLYAGPLRRMGIVRDVIFGLVADSLPGGE